MHARQLLLMPVDPREQAQAMGLDWWAVLKLRDDGWLSFDPDAGRITDEGMEAEFTFLGSLVAAGCDPRLLERLLCGLERPYRHSLSEIYYDWRRQAWRPLPRERDPGEVLADWLSDLAARGDTDALRQLLADVERTLDDAQETTPEGTSQGDAKQGGLQGSAPMTTRKLRYGR